MKYGRLIILVLVAFIAVAGFWLSMQHNAKYRQMLHESTEKMKEVRERDYGKSPEK